MLRVWCRIYPSKFFIQSRHAIRSRALDKAVKRNDINNEPQQTPLICAFCRWKAVSLGDKKDGLLVFGGDPLDFDGVGRIYLNDLWQLNFEEDSITPKWQQLHYGEGQSFCWHASSDLPDISSLVQKNAMSPFSFCMTFS